MRLDEFEPHPAKIDVKAAVKEKLGPPPDPPSSGMDQEHMMTQIDELTFKLKKALLQAKSQLNTAVQAKAASQRKVDELGHIPLEVKVVALQRTRDELIQWIESELSKVTEEDEEESPAENHYENGYSGYQVQAQVHQLYERYVSARESLIEDIAGLGKETLPDTLDSGTTPSTMQSPAKAGGAAQPTLTATELLKYLPALVQTSRDEATLLQQTAFLRKQVNLASSETKRTVQRLAGESHLVPPDTTDILAWDAAAEESTKKTRAFVHKNVQEGKASIGHAREALADLQAKRSALAHLKGNV
jgi:hypothetical protein